MVPQDLSKDGYVEEEYFVSGLANVYDWPAPGPATIRTANAPYTTRILVRRPADPAKSSGNVVVEMFNPSNLMDINIGWAIMQKQFERTGDTWVGITIRPNALQALKTFNPTRYASLSMADPVPPAQRACTVTGIEANQERGLAWDINSQVAQWFRSDAASNPLRGRITKVFGFGYSQTGGYLNTYVNAIHKIAQQPSGAPEYDGYFIAVAAPGFVGLNAINNCSATPSATDPRQQTGNQGVPIIRAMSLSDYITGIRGRRADSDDPADPYRHYEIAGDGPRLAVRAVLLGAAGGQHRGGDHAAGRPPATRARAAASRRTSRSTRSCRTSRAGRAPASRRRASPGSTSTRPTSRSSMPSAT